MSTTSWRTTALVLASVLAAGCGRRDLNAGRVDPAEVTGPMTLVVVVRDDRAFVGTGDPIEGAEVYLDDAAGRRGGTTDRDGSLSLEDVPTDGSASLTVWAEGYPALSILGLGAEGLAVPSRLQIGLGTLTFCWVCSQTFESITGEIRGRVDPSGQSAVAVSLPGTWSVSTAQSYAVPLAPLLDPGPADGRHRARRDGRRRAHPVVRRTGVGGGPRGTAPAARSGRNGGRDDRDPERARSRR
jgi:hypothetical protein